MTKPYCLAHIPLQLVTIKAHDAFLNWLASLPLNPIERKSCLMAWAAEIGYKVTREDVLAAQAEIAPPTKPPTKPPIKPKPK